MTNTLQVPYKPQPTPLRTKLLTWLGLTIGSVFVMLLFDYIVVKPISPPLFRDSVLIEVIVIPIMMLFIMMSYYKPDKSNKYIHVDSNGFQLNDYTMIPWNIVTNLEIVNGLLMIDVVKSELNKFKDKDSVMIYRDKLALNIRDYQLESSDQQFLDTLQSFRTQTVS